MSLPVPTRLTVCAGEDGEFSARGGDALVYVLDQPLKDGHYQAIAERHTDVGATVFVISESEGQPPLIRWFNSSCEIRRCGHGTLAAGALLAERHGLARQEFVSHARESWTVIADQDRYSLLLTPHPLVPARVETLLPLLNDGYLQKHWQSPSQEGYTLALIDPHVTLKTIEPNWQALRCIGQRALILLQKLSHEKLAFRYFAPQYGVVEDGATLSVASVFATVVKQLDLLGDHIVVQQHSCQGALMFLSSVDDHPLISGFVTLR